MNHDECIRIGTRLLIAGDVVEIVGYDWIPERRAYLVKVDVVERTSPLNLITAERDRTNRSSRWTDAPA